MLPLVPLKKIKKAIPYKFQNLCTVAQGTPVVSDYPREICMVTLIGFWSLLFAPAKQMPTSAWPCPSAEARFAPRVLSVPQALTGTDLQHLHIMREFKPMNAAQLLLANWGLTLHQNSNQKNLPSTGTAC